MAPHADAATAAAAAAAQPPADADGAAAPSSRSAPQPPPPPAAAAFAPGDRVTIKRYGAAEVVEPLLRDRASPHHGRVRIRYCKDGSTRWARPETLRPLPPRPPCRVLIAATTPHYRQAALAYAGPDDVALEVGCHEGVTTELLRRRVRFVVGVDKSYDPVRLARRRYPAARFEQVDGFDLAALRALSPTGTFDKVYIDIGGIAALSTVMALVGLYVQELKQCTVIVKSKFFAACAAQCAVFTPADRPQKALRVAEAATAAGGGEEEEVEAAAAAAAGGEGEVEAAAATEEEEPISK